MPLLLFHNIGTGNSLLDLIIVLIGLLVILTSDFFIIYGVTFLVRHWRDFDPTWQKVLLLAPVILFGIGIFPFAGWLFSVPFGLFGGVPFLVMLAQLGEIGVVLAGIGTVLNGLGFVGLLRFIERRREKRALSAQALP